MTPTACAGAGAVVTPELASGRKIGDLGGAAGGAVTKLLMAMELWPSLGLKCSGEFCCSRRRRQCRQQQPSDVLSGLAAASRQPVRRGERRVDDESHKPVVASDVVGKHPITGEWWPSERDECRGRGCSCGDGDGGGPPEWWPWQLDRPSQVGHPRSAQSGTGVLLARRLRHAPSRSRAGRVLRGAFAGRYDSGDARRLPVQTD